MKSSAVSYLMMAVIKHMVLFLSNYLTKQSRAKDTALHRPVLSAHAWEVSNILKKQMHLGAGNIRIE